MTESMVGLEPSERSGPFRRRSSIAGRATGCDVASTSLRDGELKLRRRRWDRAVRRPGCARAPRHRLRGGSALLPRCSRSAGALGGRGLHGRALAQRTTSLAVVRILALNREIFRDGALARLASPVPRTVPRRSAPTPGRQPSQHRRALRPGQRVLRALPGSDPHLLERGLRAPGSHHGAGLGREVRPGLPQAADRSLGSGAGDRHRLGWIRPPRGVAHRLPGDHHDDLPAPARAGTGAGGQGGPFRPGGDAPRGLPRPPRSLRQAGLDRDGRGGGPPAPRGLLPGLRRAARGRRGDAPPGHHRAGGRSRGPPPQRRLHQALHLPRWRAGLGRAP